MSRNLFAVSPVTRRRSQGSPYRFCYALVAGWLAVGLVSGCMEPTRPGWLGLNTHLGYPEYDGTGASAKTSAADRQVCFDLVGELRVPMVRDLLLNWARIQPAPHSPYDFSLSDDLVRRAQARHVDLLALCWGVPRWAAAGPGTSPVDLGVPARQYSDEFVRVVRQFVERYDGDGWADMPGLRMPIRAYQFMNEMEDIPPEEYAYWLKLFYTAVTGARAKTVVVLGGLRSPGLRSVDEPEGDRPTYFERLLADPQLAGPHRPYFDVVAFNYFPSLYPGRSEFDDPLAYLRGTMGAQGLKLPIWLTEFGCSNSGTSQEAAQADNVVKWSLRARALGIERAYLYSLWDCPRPGERGPAETMGLVREAPSGQVPAPKAAFGSFRILLAELEQRPAVTRQDEGVYRLTGKGEPVYAVWRVESYAPAPRLIPGWWEVRGLYGTRFTRQGVAIEVTDSPMFVERVSSAFLK